MKKVILSIAIIFAIGLTSCKNEAKKETKVEVTEGAKELAMAETSFGVRGNCGMCKKTIETAANGVEGVEKAVWDKAKKKMNVSFDDTKTNEDAIQNAVAASGYDTEKVVGSEDAYKNLPGCCQYDHTMEMNQSGEVGDDSVH